MSFWTWITSDAPADEIVDEKWDARLDKVCDKINAVRDRAEDTVDSIVVSLNAYSDTEDRPWWKLW